MDTWPGRKYERIPLSKTVEITDMSTGITCHGQTIDLSRGGLGFFAERFIPAGTHVCVTLSVELDGKPTVVTTLATIARAEPEGSGGIMGAAFDDPLSPVHAPLLCAVVDAR
jgi:hypothetical protein